MSEDTMKNLFFLVCKKLEYFFIYLWRKLSCIYLACRNSVSSFKTMFLMFSFNSFSIQLSYFILLSLLCFLALKVSNPKTVFSKAKNIDVFFMSVSAATVSSMSTLDMEVFSNAQLVVLTIFMFMGGEIFNSMLGLHFMKFKYLKKMKENKTRILDSVVISDLDSSTSNTNIAPLHQVELSIEKPEITLEVKSLEDAKYNAIRSLGYVVLSYILVVHAVGSVLIMVYMRLVSSAKRVLMEKGISIATFSIFSTVSSVSNCGFIPTNENMVIFKKNRGLILILIPQILAGNTLYPLCLRLVILLLEKATKRVEFSYMLKNCKEIGYGHLLSNLRCWYLSSTVFGFLLIQLVLFLSMEWNNFYIMNGLNFYEKIVGSLFEVVNSRHAGESVFDLSRVSSAILVVFVFMMYLPPYTSFIPRLSREELEENNCRNDKKIQRKGNKMSVRMENLLLLFSPLSYLFIFTTFICITEREKIKDDPLNFNVLNIIVEVISAYGNVGFSMGYSCERRMKVGGGGYCKEAGYGFVGRWSENGKILLIFVMVFGRLKKFSLKGGSKFWDLS